MHRPRLETPTATIVVLMALTPALPNTLAAQGSDLRPWARGPVLEATLEATSGPDVILSRVWGIDVDSKGRVYVRDDQTRGVIVLSPDLTYERTLGRRGGGPGEFRHVSTVQILPDDSVLVYDRNQNRITVFPPGATEPAYVQRLPGGPYREVFKVPEGLVAIGTSAYEASGADVGIENERLLRLRPDGSVATALFAFPRKENLVYRRGDPRGGGVVSISSHPFGHRPFVRIVPGNAVRVVYASSLAPEATVIDVESGRQAALSYPEAPTVSVTRKELRAAAERKSTRFARMLREGGPYVWPPLTGVVAGDGGLVMLGIRTTDRRVWEWASFRADGTHAASVVLPSGVVVYAQRESRLIGTITDEFDTPRIVAYRVGSDALEARR